MPEVRLLFLAAVNSIRSLTRLRVTCEHCGNAARDANNGNPGLSEDG